MKKLFAVLLVSSFIGFSSCGNECDPGQIPIDDNINLMLKSSNDNPFLSFANGVLPDSVRITNLATGVRLTSAYLIKDSMLVIEEYNKANGAVTNYKIAKGTILKADTLTVTVVRQDVADGCSTPYNVARFSSIKVNNTTLCTNCSASTKYRYLRP
jgi:hypothetical protein